MGLIPPLLFMVIAQSAFVTLLTICLQKMDCKVLQAPNDADILVVMTALQIAETQPIMLVATDKTY
jgi:hypothetical protein